MAMEGFDPDTNILPMISVIKRFGKVVFSPTPNAPWWPFFARRRVYTACLVVALRP